MKEKLHYLLTILTLLAGINTATAQGVLTNGWTYKGTIAPVGDSDSWTFSATNGDSIVIRVGEITSTNGFTPRIRLFNPSAVQQGLASSTVAAEISIRATNTGTFTVIVDDYFGTSATGTYRLTLAKTGSPVVTSPGDEGGPMTNGVMHTGTIDVGDLDVWTFTANSGDNLVIRMGKMVSSDTLYPYLRLYSPDGTLLGTYNSTAAAEVSARATNSGTFTVVAGDFDGGNFIGSGTYRLTLAKTGSPVVTSPGDEGGPMTNGVMHTGTIDVGDLDVWTFTANSGDNLVIRMGKMVSSDTLYPYLRLYSPDGTLLGTYNSTAAAEVSARATNSGTFTVVAGDFDGGNFIGSGTYRLTLAKTGSPVVTSPGDEGGPMTNGVMHTGTIDVGDLDVWTFTANSGDNLVIRMGKMVSSDTLYPYLRLYSPDGTLLGTYNSTAAAEVSARATNSGTFTVVAGDFDGGNFIGSGTYRLTLAKTGSPVVTSPGDEGGPMNGSDSYNGTIDVGDLDVWIFTARVGDNITLQMAKLDVGSTLYPYLRLYGRDGSLLNSISSVTTAQISRSAPASGNYMVVAGDADGGNFIGTGTYQLTVNGLSDGFKAGILIISGTNLNVGAVGGTLGTNVVLLTTTNLAIPAFWTPIQTNQFDQFGVFDLTNVLNTAESKRFYRLSHP